MAFHSIQFAALKSIATRNCSSICLFHLVINRITEFVTKKENKHDKSAEKCSCAFLLMKPNRTNRVVNYHFPYTFIKDTHTHITCIHRLYETKLVIDALLTIRITFGSLLAKCVHTGIGARAY